MGWGSRLEKLEKGGRNGLIKLVQSIGGGCVYPRFCYQFCLASFIQLEFINVAPPIEGPNI